jgi:hypothetical protein
VAVYIDFDDVVQTQYTLLHGAEQFDSDRARNFGLSRSTGDRELRERFSAARLDLDAIFEYASSFGAVVVRHAYGDWSLSSNAFYQQQLTAWAVDLTQLFTPRAAAAAGTGIRLSVDVMDDLARPTELTHVVIVGGTTDYSHLARRLRTLGISVISIAAAGAQSSAAFDEVVSYDELVTPAKAEGSHVDSHSASHAAPSSDIAEVEVVDELGQRKATNLLVEVLTAGHEQEGAEWLFSATVKNRMLQLDPGFDEAKLGYRSFTGFMKSREAVAEIIDEEGIRKVKLRA